MGEKHIIVVGSGSVGKRHLGNLRDLGCSLSVVDPREDRLAEAATLADLKGRYTSLTTALENSERFTGAVVASPPSFHCDQCLSLSNAGLPILLEKPVSPDLGSSENLQNSLSQLPDNNLLLGYTYRWWPPLSEFLDMINSGRIGKPLHARFIMSAHLADWHPWERYQDFFMSSKELGGGALLDESHFIDLMLWFFGMPDRVSARVEKLSNLEIDTDDNVDMLAVYESGLRVMIHLDLFGRPHEKYIRVTGEEGTLQWSFDPNEIVFSNEMTHKWERNSFQYERNDMFVLLAEEFLAVLDGTKTPSCTLRDGIDVLRVIEAARDSSMIEKTVKI